MNEKKKKLLASVMESVFEMESEEIMEYYVYTNLGIDIDASNGKYQILKDIEELYIQRTYYIEECGLSELEKKLNTFDRKCPNHREIIRCYVSDVLGIECDLSPNVDNHSILTRCLN